ncbi:hypothetical protein BJ741DRAFT_601864 [Chytriomyces cf. hyalinus JEL632]|nr:hypothetical protein BJ741DRAFT_601864 [Chytriomyces cf. hyalinus JEL632]
MSIRAYNAVLSTYGTTNCDAANTVFAQAMTVTNCTASGSCPTASAPHPVIGVAQKDTCVKDYASFIDSLFKYSPYGYLESGTCPSGPSAFSVFHVLNVCTLLSSGTASELWFYYPQNKTLTQSTYADTACRVLTGRNVRPLKETCDSTNNIYRVFSVPLPPSSSTSSTSSSTTTSATASSTGSGAQAPAPGPVQGDNKVMIIIGVSLGAVLLLILAFCMGAQRRKQKEALKSDPPQINSIAPTPELQTPGMTTTDADRMRQSLPAVPLSTYHARPPMQSSLMSVYQTRESSMAARDRGESFAFQLRHPTEREQKVEESPPEYSAMPHSGISTTSDMKL